MNIERPFSSNNQRKFVRDALLKGTRVDGRQDSDSRRLRVELFDNGRSEVQLGRSRAAGVVTATIVAPFVDRPSQGVVSFEVVLSPMASASFPKDTFTERAVELSRLLERTLRDAGAIETESLCVLSGSKVWSLQVAVHILDDGGNLWDLTLAAAIAALLHYRRPAVSVGADGHVTIHSPKERDPAPLAVHHIPLSVTFGFVAAADEKNVAIIVDPTDEEEQVLDGTMTVAVNAHREICSVHKGGGCPVPQPVILRCLSLASARAMDSIQIVTSAVDAALKKSGAVGKRNLVSYLEAQE